MILKLANYNLVPNNIETLTLIVYTIRRKKWSQFKQSVYGFY